MEPWNELKIRGESAINDLCVARNPEGQRLEFKRKSSPEREGISEDDRRSLAESLSAFSNAEGGIIIFGIADEHEDGIDVANQPQPISNLAGFVSCLKALILEYLSPPNPDIEVIAIPSLSRDGAGYAAIRVGRSDMRPHMSLGPKHQRYYLRVSASNQPMVDFQVRDMLRINTSPILKIGFQLISASNSCDGQYETRLIISLFNAGVVSAKRPYLIIHSETTLHSIGSASEFFEPLPLADTTLRGFQGSGRLAIHPGLEVPAVAFLAHMIYRGNDIRFRLDARTRQYVPWSECGLQKLVISTGAENTALREVAFSIEPQILAEMADQLVRSQRGVAAPSRY